MDTARIHNGNQPTGLFSLTLPLNIPPQRPLECHPGVFLENETPFAPSAWPSLANKSARAPSLGPKRSRLDLHAAVLSSLSIYTRRACQAADLHAPRAPCHRSYLSARAAHARQPACAPRVHHVTAGSVTGSMGFPLVNPSIYPFFTDPSPSLLLPMAHAGTLASNVLEKNSTRHLRKGLRGFTRNIYLVCTFLGFESLHCLLVP